MTDCVFLLFLCYFRENLSIVFDFLTMLTVSCSVMHLLMLYKAEAKANIG